MYYFDQIGVRWNDALSFEVVGKRRGGSFRPALRDYGFTRNEIARVIEALDCDREAMIYRGSHRIELRPL